MSEKLKPIMGGLNQIANKIRAYHGSPHKFDRFDISKIGTGEGNQSYGHGLYFAENPAVALDYQRHLAKPYFSVDASEDLSKKYGDDVLNVIEKTGGDKDEIEETIWWLRSTAERDLKEAGVSDVSQLASKYPGDYASSVSKRFKRADDLEAIIRSGDIKTVYPGHLYEVDLKVPRERLINADEGWTYQPKEAMQVFDHYLKDEPWRQPEWAPRGRHQPSGLDEYFGLAARLSNKPIGSWTSPEARAKASNVLNEAGVPGIQYFDQGSRGAGTGTRNIVMFDDAPIEIVERKAKGGILRKVSKHV